MTSKLVNGLRNVCLYVLSGEYIPVWCGMLLFGLASLVRYLSGNLIGVLDLQTWPSSLDLYNQLASVSFIASYVVMIIVTALMIGVVHYARDGLGFDVVIGYIVVFVTVFVSRIIGTNVSVRNNGFGTSLWCIIFGCLFRVIYPKSKHISEKMLSYEFFIKIGIVVFAVDLHEILQLGLRGFIVGWCDTIVLLTFVFCIGVYVFGMEKRTVILIACGLSICGSSAVISVSDALKYDGDNMILIAVMAILTVPYIPSLPAIAKAIGLDDRLAGMWIGGTVDSTGAVVASASLLSKQGLDSAIVLKMMQNLLIGPVSLAVACVWHSTFNLQVMWDKFPKFVLGFVLVSSIVFLFSSDLKELVVKDCFVLTELFSNISFVLIGVEIDLTSILTIISKNWKICVLYLVGQNVDVLTTYGFILLANKI